MLKKAPLVILQDLCLAIKTFSDSNQMKAENQLSPLHIAAETGMINLCKFIIFKTQNENPKDQKGVTALHLKYSLQKIFSVKPRYLHSGSSFKFPA